MKIGISPKDIRGINFNSMEMEFNSIVDANIWLDKLDKKGNSTEGTDIEFIPPRENTGTQQEHGKVNFRKGVISDWDKEEGLNELLDALDDREAVIDVNRLKRMRRGAEGEKVLIDTHHIIIRIKGTNLPGDLSLYGGLTRIKIRPYIEPVKQCYNCYKYGHLSTVCRNKKKCRNCGDNFHGECNRNTSCMNCNGMHPANWKGCQEYIFTIKDCNQ